VLYELSPAFTGGVRAQQQMNETLASIPARYVLRPQIVTGGMTWGIGSVLIEENHVDPR
jgi:hypothetical protein